MASPTTQQILDAVNAVKVQVTALQGQVAAALASLAGQASAVEQVRRLVCDTQAIILNVQNTLAGP